VAKKSLKHKKLKLDDEQVSWIIEVAVGAQLQILMRLERESALETVQMLASYVRHSAKEKKYVQDVDLFINDMLHHCVELYSRYAKEKLKVIIVEGVTKQSLIIQPSTLMN